MEHVEGGVEGPFDAGACDGGAPVAEAVHLLDLQRRGAVVIVDEAPTPLELAPEPPLKAPSIVVEEELDDGTADLGACTQVPPGVNGLRRGQEGIIPLREPPRINKRLLKAVAAKTRSLRFPEKATRSAARARVTLNMFFKSSRNDLSNAPLSWSADDLPSAASTEDGEDTVIVSITPLRSNPGVTLIPCADNKGKRKVHSAKMTSSLSRKERGESSGGSTAAKPLLEVISEDELSDNSDSDFERLPPAKKRHNKEYDRNRRFHCEWSARFPWAEGIIEEGVHFVKCLICSKIDGRPKLMAPKTDTLM